jgi:HEAT repeat protein
MLAPPPLPRTVEASFRDLGASRPEVRVSSIEDLARHAARDPQVRARALAPLEKALKDDFGGVRSAAAVALADLRARESLPALLVAIEDPDPHVRQMALTALGEIGDPRAAPRLERALSDRRPEVRYQAVIAYSRVVTGDDRGRTSAMAALRAAMKDDDDSVRYIALRLVEERIDAHAASEVDAATRSAIVTLLDQPAHVAVVAAIVLLKLGDAAPPAARTRAEALLVRVVDRTLRLPGGTARAAQEDEREAVELTGVLGIRAAVPALEQRAFGLRHFVADTCAYSATIALARLGHERAKSEIMRGLRSRSRAKREAAVVAVGRARMVEARPVVAGLTGNDVDPELVARTLHELGEPAVVTRPEKDE